MWFSIYLYIESVIQEAGHSFGDPVPTVRFRLPKVVAIVDDELLPVTPPVATVGAAQSGGNILNGRDRAEADKLRILEQLDADKARLLAERKVCVSEVRHAEQLFAGLLEDAVVTARNPRPDDRFAVEEICIVNLHLVCEVSRIFQDREGLSYEVLYLVDGITEYSTSTDMMSFVPRVAQAAIRKARREKLRATKALEEVAFALARISGQVQELDRALSITPRTNPDTHDQQDIHAYDQQEVHAPSPRRLLTPPKRRTSTTDASKGELEKIQNDMAAILAAGTSIDERRRIYKSLLLKYHPDKLASQPAQFDDRVFQYIHDSKTWFLA